MDVDALYARVSPELQELFAPAPAAAVDEDAGRPVELLGADLVLDAGRLRGTVRARGLAQGGARVLIDLRGGPAPDVEVGVGAAWARLADVQGWRPGKDHIVDGTSTLAGDTLTVDVPVDGVEAGHAGWMAVSVGSPDRSFVDPGPGGRVGPPSDGARRMFLALAAHDGVAADPDLAAALALTFGSLAAVAASEVQDEAVADALAWFDYGRALDDWLAERGAGWRLGTASPVAKLLWAWPATQGVVYGAAAVGAREAPLSAEAWRFLVPDVGTLAALRDGVVIQPDVAVTADLADRAIWTRLRYRAGDAQMAAWCDLGSIDEAVCRSWDADRREGLTLGTLDGVPIAMSEGTSATVQLAVYRRHREFIGDCATATALAMSTFQAVGIPSAGLGWNGATLAAPTHDLPLFLAGDRLYAPQSSPGRATADPTAWVYVTLPLVSPTASSLGWEPGGGSHGGAVAGGLLTHEQLATELTRGLPLSLYAEWLRTGAGGGWPGW